MSSSTASAPSGANHQPWHFVAIRESTVKHAIREAADDAWLEALEPIGARASKPHLDIAPWLIVVFAWRHGVFDDGECYKHYYAGECVGIATGFLLSALDRLSPEKPVKIIAAEHPSPTVTVPRNSHLHLKHRW